MKETGLGWTTHSIDNAAGTLTDVRNDITNFNFATPIGIQDVTGIDKFGVERLALLRDFNITNNFVFNPTGIHSVLKTVTASPGPRTLDLEISESELEVEVLVTDYALTRNADGSLTGTAPASLADGTIPEWDAA